MSTYATSPAWMQPRDHQAAAAERPDAEPAARRRGRPHAGAVPAAGRRLGEQGVITGYTALVHRDPPGRGFQVMIHADLVAGDLANVEAFDERIADMYEEPNSATRSVSSARRCLR